MGARIIDEERRHRSSRATEVLAYVGAAGFAIASALYGLALTRVTVAPEPVFSGDEPLTEQLTVFYRWYVSTLPQERIYTSLAILAFVCLASVGVLILRSMEASVPLARVGGVVLTLGASLWIVGNVLQLGGHRAVGAMATHGNPLPAVNAIAFTIDIIGDAFDAVAFASLGVGLLLCAWAGARVGAPGWSRYTGAIGLVGIVVAAAYIMDEGDIVNALLLALGVVLLPIWLVWTGIGSPHGPRNVTSQS
jgi:hypothetical protein